MTHEDKAREIVRNAGGICLLGPGITSHEHTFCDCTVEKFIADALRAARNEALEDAARTVDEHHAGRYDIANAIRSLKQDKASDSPATTG